VKTSVTTEEQSSGQQGRGAHAAGEQWRGTGMEGKRSKNKKGRGVRVERELELSDYLFLSRVINAGGR